MNTRLSDIHQGDETGVLLRLDDFLHYEWRGKTYENNRASKTEICWGILGNIKKYFWGSREHAVEFPGNLTRVNLREH